MSQDSPTRARWVRCPACGNPALYSADNPERPFCSPRCRSFDLGAWASESYRMATDPSPETDEGSASPGVEH